MEKVNIELEDRRQIKIKNIGGDLRLSAWENSSFEAQAATKGKLKVKETSDGVEVECRSGCLMFLPEDARVETENVGGDVRIKGVYGEIMIRTIGGDISIHRVGRSSIEVVGGDVQAQRVAGDLTIDRIGGDAVVQRLAGDLRLRGVGGDLVIYEIEGIVDASVGGDTIATMDPEPSTKSAIHTGGDLSCRLPTSPSAAVTIRAGGDVQLPSSAEQETVPGGVIVKFGDSESVIELSAGGDIKLEVGESEMDYGEAMVGDILRDVDAKLAEMEARFDAMGAGMTDFDADRVGERVRRAVVRAQRKADKARRKSGAQTWDGGMSAAAITQGSEEALERAAEEERLAVLRMVEKGKISVDEAETLFQALEGNS
jgi:hypothetical protein